MRVVDLIPKPICYEPICNKYELYATVVEARCNEEVEAEMGVIREDCTCVIEDKAEVIALLNELTYHSQAMLTPDVVKSISNETLRASIENIYNTEHYQLFISKVAVVYYDDWGRKCRVSIEEE